MWPFRRHPSHGVRNSQAWWLLRNGLVPRAAGFESEAANVDNTCALFTEPLTATRRAAALPQMTNRNGTTDLEADQGLEELGAALEAMGHGVGYVEMASGLAILAVTPEGLQGGADWMMAFSDKAAVKALVAYLSSELGGANWAAATFGVSPNRGATGNYSDAALTKFGDALAATSGFTPDIGDTIAGFGDDEWAAIINYVNGGDLMEGLDAAAAAQAEATSGN